MTDRNIINFNPRPSPSAAQKIVADGAARSSRTAPTHQRTLPLLRGLDLPTTPDTADITSASDTSAKPAEGTVLASDTVLSDGIELARDTELADNTELSNDSEPIAHAESIDEPDASTPAEPATQNGTHKETSHTAGPHTADPHATTKPRPEPSPFTRPSDDEVIEHQISVATEFLKRRLNGDYHVDTYGYDEHFNDHIALGLLRILYRHWFRVETRGVENVPTNDGALLVANHSGTIALDSLMLLVALHDEHPAQRNLRLLGADLVFQAPIIGNLARKIGVTLASHADANRLLADGHTVGVFPEGFKGIGKPFSDRYKLQRFGRGGFVSAALQARKPIIPCAIVGAEETYPMIADIKILARLLGVPFCPITPTWPLLGPLGVVPLPTKWTIEFGTPIPTDGYSDEDLDDAMLVFELTDRVRETIQETLYSLLVTRKSVFH